MGREILIAQIAADALEIGVDGVRDLAFVKCVAPALRDQRQGVGEVGVSENFAFLGRVSASGDEIGVRARC